MKPYLDALVRYAINHGLIAPDDEIYCYNALLSVLQLDEAAGDGAVELPLAEILRALCDDAVQRGIIEDTVTARDLFDTKLMGALTPLPHEVRAEFARRYAVSPRQATDWYYAFSCATNYIRTDRIQKDLRWKYPGQYGELDITINLSKPEKDPRAIAAAKSLPQTNYPKCLLCEENEGYAGRMNHPARQNHRIIPLTIAGRPWYLQYSPYVYYNEHCIVFNKMHTPMTIDRSVFDKLLDFTEQFPHYFIGSNADLPIVGGSILSHEHFQGGNYTFAMAKAPVETPLSFAGYPEVSAGIIRWPMSVIRLSSTKKESLCGLADKILTAWRSYTDEAALILAETDGIPHNTITPIARRDGDAFVLDLVLRNNITTDEHPLGVYHPHEEYHHIKKENIGLIEVMGLAVLPARLKTELSLLKEAILSGRRIEDDERIAKHAAWAEELKKRHTFTQDNAEQILFREVGAVFEKILENAGVYSRDAAGKAAFLRFVDAVNKQ